VEIVNRGIVAQLAEVVVNIAVPVMPRGRPHIRFIAIPLDNPPVSTERDSTI
jgi:hypothetical protein